MGTRQTILLAGHANAFANIATSCSTTLNLDQRAEEGQVFSATRRHELEIATKWSITTRA